MSNNPKRHRILLTNDDGFERSEGMKNIFEVLAEHYHVTVVAPLYEHSGASHSITILSPIFVNQMSAPGRRGIYALKGTPADCVKIACSHLLKRRPDFVVSGINLGANVGLDVFYSGTVAAALEASFWGVTAFAVSMERPSHRRAQPDLKHAARIAQKIIHTLISLNPPRGSVFNINIPLNVPAIKGVKFTRNDLHLIKDNFIKGVDPRGRPYFWMKSGIENRYNRLAGLRRHQKETSSDVRALKDGYISVTPLQTNITDERFLNSPKAQSIWPDKIGK